VEVRFRDRGLRDLVASKRNLVRRFGEPCARKIAQRLQQLHVAETLHDVRLMAGRCHQLTGDRVGCLALDLVHPRRLVFEPTDPAEEPLDWRLVKAVTVLEIVDYH
jgi:plasmid maintenance system killer protein